jgi:hypothetical protein
VLAATGAFVVPALVFWLCSSVALAGLATLRGAGLRRTWPVLATSDALVCAAAIVYVAREDAWAIPGPAAGAVFWALAGAAAIRAAVLLAAPAAVAAARLPAAPLLAGGAVVLAVRAGRPEPWLALAFLAGAATVVAVSLARGAVSPDYLGTWLLALSLAVCFVAPDAAPAAGAAAILGVTAAALWAFTGEHGSFERALLAAGVPLTAGYPMIAAGATVAFERATGGGGSAAAWTIVAALLPGALAGGVVLGGRAARVRGGGFVAEAVLATWVLLAAALFVGLAPGAVGGPRSSGGILSLHLVALACGAGTALAVNRGKLALGTPRVEKTTLRVDVPSAIPRAAELASGALGLATAGAAAWLTVWGLRVGFL